MLLLNRSSLLREKATVSSPTLITLAIVISGNKSLCAIEDNCVQGLMAMHKDD